MALYFTMGTAGELIKMYPLLKLAEERGLAWRCLHTGQSGVNFWRQWDDFSLPRDKAVLLTNSDSDLKASSSALRWFLSTSMWTTSYVRDKISASHLTLDSATDILVVHGDTLSTLAGAFLGWRLGVRVAHIEAGLRSRYLLQPFPEEINRRITSEFVTWHFCPDELAVMNLKRAGFDENVFNTRGNTLIDAIRFTLKANGHEPKEKYAVANLHRHENLNSFHRWQQLIDATLAAQKVCPVEFVMHPPTEAKLSDDGAAKKKLLDAGVRLSPRKRFGEFIQMLNGAHFVLSDGGSNQEECSYLGVPCLLMRDTTERVEGLGENVVLSHFRPATIENFLNDPNQFRRPPLSLEVQPTQSILQVLAGC